MASSSIADALCIHGLPDSVDPWPRRHAHRAAGVDAVNRSPVRRSLADRGRAAAASARAMGSERCKEGVGEEHDHVEV